MSMWGRTAVPQSALRAVVAVLASVLLVLTGSASAGMERVSVREEALASASLSDDSSDECVACAPEQRVPRPGRVGRPAGRLVCPPAFTSSAGGTGGLPGGRVPPRPGDTVAAGHAQHSVLRC